MFLGLDSKTKMSAKQRYDCNTVGRPWPENAKGNALDCDFKNVDVNDSVRKVMEFIGESETTAKEKIKNILKTLN